VLASAAVSTERECADLTRALDVLQARLDAHVAALPKAEVAMSAANPAGSRGRACACSGGSKGGCAEIIPPNEDDSTGV
jgi:hypothetical protein